MVGSLNRVPVPGPGWARALFAGLVLLGALAGCAAPGAAPTPDPFAPPDVGDGCRDPFNPTFVFRDCQ